MMLLQCVLRSLDRANPAGEGEINHDLACGDGYLILKCELILYGRLAPF
jgi:hypothetical protein